MLIGQGSSVLRRCGLRRVMIGGLLRRSGFGRWCCLRPEWSPNNDEIAGRLVISPPTAKSYVRNILRKLDCHDRAGLVDLAYECGLI